MDNNFSADLIKARQIQAFDNGLLEINDPNKVEKKKDDDKGLMAYVVFMMAYLGSHCKSAKIMTELACRERLEQNTINQISQLKDPRDQKKLLEKMKVAFKNIGGMPQWLDKKIGELKPFIDAINKAEAALKQIQDQIDYPVFNPFEERKEAKEMGVIAGTKGMPLNVKIAARIAQGWHSIWGSTDPKKTKKVQQFFFPSEWANKKSKQSSDHLQGIKNEMDKKKGINKVDWVGHPGALIDLINIGWYSKTCGGENVTKRDAAKSTYNIEKQKQSGDAASYLSQGVGNAAEVENDQIQTSLQAKAGMSTEVAKLISQIIIN